MEFRLKHPKDYYRWVQCNCKQEIPLNPNKRKTKAFCPKCGSKLEL